MVYYTFLRSLLLSNFLDFFTNIFCACVTCWNLICCNHLSIGSAIAFIIKRIGRVKPFLPNIWFCWKTFRIFYRRPKNLGFLKGMVLTNNHTLGYSFFDEGFLFLHSPSGWAKVLPDVAKHEEHTCLYDTPFLSCVFWCVHEF